MTAQHTPKPWKPSPSPFDYSAEWILIESPTHDRDIADIHIWDDQARADARLIAAAPLMLEALQALMTAYATIPGMSGLPMHDPDAWHKARDAIRAATGEDA